MSIVQHKQLASHLKQLQLDDLPQLILICGDDFLVRSALDAVSSFFETTGDKKLLIESLDGTGTAMTEILESITTFSFLGQGKVLVVKKAPLFQNTGTTNSGSTAYSQEDLDSFTRHMNTGLPNGHYLVMTCQNADKRKKIYKALEPAALVIDCAVPSGSRKADIENQNHLMADIVSRKFAAAGKTIHPQAQQRLLDLTGFHLDLLSTNLDKLCAYIGQRTEATIQDVDKVIVRDKKDPIFNLTNALMAKDLPASLFYLDTMLRDGMHVLQILKAIENMVRKLLMVKCAAGNIRTIPQSGIRQMGFNGFKQRVLPDVTTWDKRVRENTDEAALMLPKTGKKAQATDLLLAPNPKNAYPVFQIFLKSENFSMSDLSRSMTALSDLDHLMKSSVTDARSQIEQFMIRLCR